MTETNAPLHPTTVESFDAYDICVSLGLATMVVSAMWVMVVLCFSLPAETPKRIERPLQTSVPVTDV